MRGGHRVQTVVMAADCGGPGERDEREDGQRGDGEQPGPGLSAVEGAGAAISRRIRTAVSDPPAPSAAAPAGADAARASSAPATFSRGRPWWRRCRQQLDEPGDLLMALPDRAYPRERRQELVSDTSRW